MTPSDKSTKLTHLFNGQINGAHVYFLIRTLFCAEEINALFTDEATMNAEISKNIENTQILIDSQKGLSTQDLISYLELTQYTGPTLLRDTDVMSMANGLEVRVPYLDHKLVELMFSIPTQIKINHRKHKSLLLKSLNKKLPKQIANRKKMGFTLPFENWMRGKLKSEIESVILTPSPQLTGYISENGIKKIWTNSKARRKKL